MAVHEEGLLSPYRILELPGVDGCICGRMLGDMGGDVIKIEPPGGDPARSIGPFYQDEPHPEKSLFWFAYNANKRGITINLESEPGRKVFLRLVETADAVVESFPPGYLREIGLAYEDLCKGNPDLVFTSITPFGQDGPYRNLKGSDMVCWAMGGMMYLCGDPDRPPVQVTFPQAFFHAGGDGAVATTFAIYHRNRTGQGQRIDVSAQACATWTTMQAPVIWSVNRMNVRRAGIYRDRPAIKSKDRQIWECKDGYVHFLLLGGTAGASYMPQVTRWLEEEGLATAWLSGVDWAKGYDDYLLKPEDYERIEGPLSDFFRRFTKRELYEKAREDRVHLYPVFTAKDIFEDEHLRSREFWLKIEHSELGAVIPYPGSALKLSRNPLAIRRRAPLLGEHNQEIYCGELGISKENLETMKQQGIL